MGKCSRVQKEIKRIGMVVSRLFEVHSVWLHLTLRFLQYNLPSALLPSAQPEAPLGVRWQERGWQIVLQEAQRQVQPDGCTSNNRLTTIPMRLISFCTREHLPMLMASPSPPHSIGRSKRCWKFCRG